MSKTYKFIDLLSEIELEKIEENTKFKVSDNYNLFRPQIATYRNRELKIEEENIFNFYDLDYLLHADFELLEDEEKNEIDIQSIKELAEDRYIVTDVLKKINELVQAIKQLDNKRNNT